MSDNNRRPPEQVNRLYGSCQKRTVQITINLPMKFPGEWNNEMIEFHLNESSWCFSNIIELLEEYDSKHGCLCSICKAKVL